MHKTKKYIYVFSCIFLMTLILSGCADTPDEVKQEITEIEKAKEEQRELKKSLTYVHASELQKDRRDNFSMNHGVLCFEGSVNIPDCENVYLLEMKVNDEIFKKIEKNMLLVMDQVGVDEKEWTKYIIAENGIDEKGGAATDKSYAERGYCSVEVDDFIITADQAGYLSINQVMENEDHTYFLKNGKILRNYYFVNDEKKECNDKVDLPDKTVILETLKDMFEKKVELVNSCSPNLNLVVHDARICENTETKNKMVVFRALGGYKGVCFDPDYILSQEAKLMNGRSFVGFEMNQQIHEEEDACAIALRETSYIVSQEKKRLTK